MKRRLDIAQFLTLVVVLSLALSACAGAATPVATEAVGGPMQAIGAGEGAVSIVAWAGYIERGETDPAYDWVTDFEKETGCMVSVKTAATSDEMLAFALSFDEVIVTTFTSGQQATLPIWIFSQLTRPRDRPVTNVVALFVMMITFLPILLAHRFTQDRDGS